MLLNLVSDLTTYLSSNFQLEYTWSSQRSLANETKHWEIYSFSCLCRHFLKKIELTFAVLNSSRKRCHAFYLWATLFFNLSSVLLNFFVNRLSNAALLRCCLIHVRTIILRHIFIYNMSVHAKTKVYLCSANVIFFNFHLHFHYDKSYSLINTNTLVL